MRNCWLDRWEEKNKPINVMVDPSDLAFDSPPLIVDMAADIPSVIIIDWGQPPTISVSVVVTCPDPASQPAMPDGPSDFMASEMPWIRPSNRGAIPNILDLYPKKEKNAGS